MERETLFRAKHKEYNQWVEGDLIHEPFGECIQFVKDECRSKIKVDPETICQYTGLTDKNGRKIFEGDIVSAWSEGSYTIGRVKQRTDGLWLLYPAWQNKIMWGLCPNDKGETTVEVIGNIFDNPELLEGGKNR